ncbi:MAG: alpha/beta fold hydrolase [Rubrivivax sp.]|nr:alpha/beta fold hydrolase [Rubrivivax sp.]
MRQLLIAAAALFAASAVQAQDVKIAAEDLMVPHGDASIYVRNKRPEGVASFAPDKIAIMMHGATYPGTAFDLQLGGKSWMDYMAERGYDVYALDLPGYGRSSRPAAMDQPAADNAPFMRTADAAKALGSVVDHVLKRRNAASLKLIGWSWGTSITATFTADNPGKVNRLVLYAPQWIRTTPSLVQVSGKLGAYRTVSRDQALGRWMTGVPEDKKATLIPAGWYDAWAEATFATDPKGGGKTLRAPNGVVQDGLEYWSAGKAVYDPAKITAPVLLVIGEWDQDTPPYMAQTLYPLLVNAPWKRHAMLSGGTHTIIMEQNRMLLFRTVQQFLDEPAPGGSATQ